MLSQSSRVFCAGTWQQGYLCWHRVARLFVVVWNSRVFCDLSEQHGFLFSDRVARLFVLMQNTKVFWAGMEQQGWLLWLTSALFFLGWHRALGFFVIAQSSMVFCADRE